MRPGVSRSGSTETKTTCVAPLATPLAGSPANCASVCNVVGHTSAQEVKPKKTRLQWPRRRAASKGLPSVPASAGTSSGAAAATGSTLRSSAANASGRGARSLPWSAHAPAPTETIAAVTTVARCSVFMRSEERHRAFELHLPGIGRGAGRGELEIRGEQHREREREAAVFRREEVLPIALV